MTRPSSLAPRGPFASCDRAVLGRDMVATAWMTVAALLAATSPSQAAERQTRQTVAPIAAPPMPDAAARRVEDWIVRSSDNQGLPFLIIDKINAQAIAFDAEGRRMGETPALLGLGRGDVSPQGIGDRPLSSIGPDERITPAGRFTASLGQNLAGKGVLWVDYNAALSLHVVVTTRAADRRLERLATASPVDNRISYGCINVPAGFYADIVEPLFRRTTGIVYILPEVTPIENFFDTAGGFATTPPSRDPG